MRSDVVKALLAVLLLALSSVADARTYLVSVGVTDYSGHPDKPGNLSLTVKDAQTIVGIYTNNTSVDYALLLNEKATKARIVRAIAKVFNRASEDDIVVFFFSGHGYPGGLCAYDGNLRYAEIRKAMARSKCGNKMMFVDACRSGGMRVDASSTHGEASSAQTANVMLFLSSRNNENSIERRTMRNGLFTTFLEKGLKGNADADRDRIITAKELFSFVYKGVVGMSEGRQHPVMWGKFDDNMPVMRW